MKDANEALVEEDHASEVEKSSAQAAAPPSVTSKDHESDLPIDRGYAWVIVFACLLTNVLCLGFQRAYGILFVEFLHLFNMPVGVTSLVMAIQSAFTSISALLTQTVMLSLLSERQTIITGGLIGGLGIILSYFASNLYLLILTQSCLVGSSIGMIMGPTMVIVGKYFHKRRSLAIAVATLGGNLGSMGMPVFTEALLEEFGVRGTLLVLGATFLNIMVFAGLLRPLEKNRCRRRVRKGNDDDDGDDDGDDDDDDDDGSNKKTKKEKKKSNNNNNNSTNNSDDDKNNVSNSDDNSDYRKLKTKKKSNDKEYQ